MKNIVAVNTNTFHGFSVDQALEAISQAGFKYVEIASVSSWTPHIMPDFDDAEIKRIQNKMATLGLSCIALSGHVNLTDEARLNDFRANMALANRLGAKWIISSTGEAHFGEDEVMADDVLIKNIKALLPDLEKYGLKLGIEVHGEYGTGESILKIVDGVASPLVGVNYDTANVVFYGGKNPHDEIKTCLRGVNFVHLKDKVGLDNTWNFPAIGKGDLDLVKLIRYMNEHGYEGPLSIEIEYTADFTMRDKVEGDYEIASDILKDSYRYLKENDLI